MLWNVFTRLVKIARQLFTKGEGVVEWLNRRTPGFEFKPELNFRQHPCVLLNVFWGKTRCSRSHWKTGQVIQKNFLGWHIVSAVHWMAIFQQCFPQRKVPLYTGQAVLEAIKPKINYLKPNDQTTETKYFCRSRDWNLMNGKNWTDTRLTEWNQTRSFYFGKRGLLEEIR